MLQPQQQWAEHKKTSINFLQFIFIHSIHTHTHTPSTIRFHTLVFICLCYKQNYIPARVCNYYLFGYSFFMSYIDSEHEFEQLVNSLA